MVPNTRGCNKGVYKPTHKQDTLNSLMGSPIKSLLKSRAPAPGPDFSVSLETQERFLVAVCTILVWIAIKNATSDTISYKEMWLQVRQACFGAEPVVQQLHGLGAVLQASRRANACTILLDTRFQ
jgi:hypothetical protein